MAATEMHMRDMRGLSLVCDRRGFVAGRKAIGGDDPYLSGRRCRALLLLTSADAGALVIRPCRVGAAGAIAFQAARRLNRLAGTSKCRKGGGPTDEGREGCGRGDLDHVVSPISIGFVDRETTGAGALPPLYVRTAFPIKR